MDKQVNLIQRMPYLNSLFDEQFLFKLISNTQIGMPSITIKLSLILLAVTGSLALHLSTASHNAIDGLQLTHLSSLAEHDPSSTYTLYKGSLDTIRDGIVLSPPAVAPTSSIAVTTFTPSDCKIMTSAEKDQLRIEVLLIEGKLDQVSAQLNLLPVDGTNYKTRLDLKNQQTYLQAIQDILDSDCTKNVQLSQSQFQTNLNSDRWILGDNLKFQDVIKEYSERSMINQYVTNCHDDTPFYDQAKGCIACKGKDEYWILETKKCGTCDEGEEVNLEKRVCQQAKVVPKPNNTQSNNNTETPAKPTTNQTSANTTKPANQTNPDNSSKPSTTPNASQPTNNQSTNGTKPANPANTTNNQTVTNASNPTNTSSPTNPTSPTSPLPTNPNGGNKIGDGAPNPHANNTENPNQNPDSNQTSPGGKKIGEGSPQPQTNNTQDNKTAPSSNKTANQTAQPANATQPSSNNTNATKPTQPAANQTQPSTPTNKSQNASQPSQNATKSETPADNSTKPSGANATTPNATKPLNQSQPTNGSQGNKTPNTTSPNATQPNSTQNQNQSSITTPNNTSPNATNANQTQPNATQPNNTKPANATQPNNTANNQSSGNQTTPANVSQPNNTSQNQSATSNQTKPANASGAVNTTTPNATNATTPANTSQTSNQTKNGTNANATNQTSANQTQPAANVTQNATTGNKTVTEVTPPIQKPNSSNLDYSGRIVVSSGALPKISPSDVPCPKESPFFNGSACIQCNAPYNLFNITTKKCTKCLDLEAFNEDTNKCEKLNNDFLTPKNSSNLINDGMPSAYWDYVYDQIKSKNSSVKECPTAKPYYNGKACITCAAPTEYFNLDTRKCQACTGDFVYDQTQRDCIDNSKSDHGVSSSALKMSAALFSHEQQLRAMMHGSSVARHQMTLRE